MNKKAKTVVNYLCNVIWDNCFMKMQRTLPSRLTQNANSILSRDIEALDCFIFRVSLDHYDLIHRYCIFFALFQPNMNDDVYQGRHILYKSLSVPCMKRTTSRSESEIRHGFIIQVSALPRRRRSPGGNFC